jgi:SRSO17 transposase
VHSAGASRQYIGRLGKVEMGSVMAALSYSKGPSWLMVDAEPYLPQEWAQGAARAGWRSELLAEQRSTADGDFHTRTLAV